MMISLFILFTKSRLLSGREVMRTACFDSWFGIVFGIMTIASSTKLPVETIVLV